MATGKTLDGYFTSRTQPTRSTRTKRKLFKQDEEANASDKENIDEIEAPKLKQRKTNAVSRPKAAPRSKTSNDAKAAQKIFDSSIKALEKAVASLDKRVKALGGNTRAIDISSYAAVATKQLPAVAKLRETDLILALQLMLSIADATVTDLDAAIKMCGYGDQESDFEAHDEALLSLIEKMAVPSKKLSDLPEVKPRWSRDDAEVGPFKTGNGPNKQQRNQMYAQKLEWEKERRQERRERRVETDDWISVALADLTGNRDYLDQYGVEGYMAKSISKLSELNAERRE